MTVLLLLVLLNVYFSAQKDVGYSKELQVTEQRLQELNRLITLVEKDSQIGLKIATFRAILALDENISQQSGHVNNFDETINELIINGTINNELQLFTENHSISDWENNTETLLEGIGAQTIFENTKVKLSQNNHWDVIAEYNSTLLVHDPFTNSNWIKNITTNITISITNFYDPLYSINTQGKRKIKINNSISLSDLTTLIDEEYYVASNNSPSFIQRFQNPDDYNSDDYENIGIESLIDKSKNIVPDYNRPIIDSIYFVYDESQQTCSADGYLFESGYENTYGVLCSP